LQVSIPPLPPPLESLGRRPFSFYPPVLNIEHNEWVFQHATWSEILVMNTKTGAEVWVPRRFLGEVSRVDEPVMIVGLKRELEYKAGALWPHERRIIEMKKAVNEGPRPATPEPRPGPGAVVGIRLEDGAESRIGKLIAGALVIGVVVVFFLVSLFRGRHDVKNVTFVPILQQSLGLTGHDDYKTVLRKLGQPKEDRWRSESGELQYRVLSYPERKIFVILMGKDRDSLLYIGAMDENWKPVDSVELPNAGNTRSMLNNLSRF
jgi:hypothetical protein